MKIQIIGAKVCLRCKGKTLLIDVNKLFVFKNILPLQFNQTFPTMIWIFTEVEGDGIKSRLPFKIFSTLKWFFNKYWRFALGRVCICIYISTCMFNKFGKIIAGIKYRMQSIYEISQYYTSHMSYMYILWFPSMVYLWWNFSIALSIAKHTFLLENKHLSEVLAFRYLGR